RRLIVGNLHAVVIDNAGGAAKLGPMARRLETIGLRVAARYDLAAVRAIALQVRAAGVDVVKLAPRPGVARGERVEGKVIGGAQHAVAAANAQRPALDAERLVGEMDADAVGIEPRGQHAGAAAADVQRLVHGGDG